MKFDVIVIGAGFGGLSCAAKLARSGRRVLVLEKKTSIGGTSYVFKRGSYVFPMGPLGFSHPEKVLAFLEEIGVRDGTSFTRNHFQLVTPGLDLVYSLPFGELKEKLKSDHVQEKSLEGFFTELESIISFIKDMPSWHPGYLLGKKRQAALDQVDADAERKIKRADHYSRTSCAGLLSRYIRDQNVKNLLGSMSARSPRMSLLNLAIMWNLMSYVGIWSPSCGIHGLIDRMAEAFLSCGGTLRTGSPVEEIIIQNGMAAGVKIRGGERFDTSWVVSNADYKGTFMDLIKFENLPAVFLENVKLASYTDSEMCVYLGVDPEKIDWSSMKARHLFFCAGLDEGDSVESLGLDMPEIEVCLWSDPNPGLAPPDRLAVVLRSAYPFSRFESFWIGEKRRRTGYEELKKRLADQLIERAGAVLPGLESAVEIREAATPLTYSDWGQRYRGSIAGWSWSPTDRRPGGKLLIETPIRNLLMVGIYAAAELFFGGVPTAVFTGRLAADRINE